jgi:hypothetical protein
MKEFWFFLAVVAIIGLLASIFLDRVVNPWQRKKWFEKFSKDFRDGKVKPRHFDTTIHFDETGFGVSGGKTDKPSSRMSWNEVVKVTAYKRDLFNTDLICVFLSRADQTGLEIHEEMNNWMSFIVSLPKHLPGCKSMESWLQDITIPAFATSLTEIFSRKDNFTKQESAK